MPRKKKLGELLAGPQASINNPRIGNPPRSFQPVRGVQAPPRRRRPSKTTRRY